MVFVLLVEKAAINYFFLLILPRKTIKIKIKNKPNAILHWVTKHCFSSFCRKSKSDYSICDIFFCFFFLINNVNYFQFIFFFEFFCCFVLYKFIILIFILVICLFVQIIIIYCHFSLNFDIIF